MGEDKRRLPEVHLQRKISEFSAEKNNTITNNNLDIKLFDYLIIHKFGHSIIHERKCTLNIDPELTSGLISAIVTVSRELFNNSKSLNILDFGDQKIVVEAGKYITLGIVTKFVTSDLKRHIKKLVTIVEDKYINLLQNWSGSMDEIKPVTDFINNNLSEYIIESFTPNEHLFTKTENLEDKLFNISGLESITIEKIAQIKNEISESKINEGQIYSLCRLLSHDALTFSEIKELLNISSSLLRKLLFSLYKNNILKMYKRRTERKNVESTIPIRVALQDNYLMNIGNVKTVGDFVLLDSSISFNKPTKENEAVIFPILLAVVKSKDKIIPYVMKNVDKFREIIAKEIVKNGLNQLNSKEMNLLKTIKKIDSFW
ncbi:MAG: hypothetical protein ACTSQY_07775 [Candidatus Odinarchaeia archaeon]